MSKSNPISAPMLVRLLNAKHGDATLNAPTIGLLCIQETTPDGTITKALFQPRFKGEYKEGLTVSECEFVYLKPDHQTLPTPLDADTAFRGHDGPFDYWESDHTGLVHVLWSAKYHGLTLQGDDDEIASMIVRSRWHQAVKAHAVEAERTEEATTK